MQAFHLAYLLTLVTLTYAIFPRPDELPDYSNVEEFMTDIRSDFCADCMDLCTAHVSQVQGARYHVAWVHDAVVRRSFLAIHHNSLR